MDSPTTTAGQIKRRSNSAVSLARWATAKPKRRCRSDMSVQTTAACGLGAANIAVPKAIAIRPTRRPRVAIDSDLSCSIGRQPSRSDNIIVQSSTIRTGAPSNRTAANATFVSGKSFQVIAPNAIGAAAINSHGRARVGSRGVSLFRRPWWQASADCPAVALNSPAPSEARAGDSGRPSVPPP